MGLRGVAPRVRRRSRPAVLLCALLAWLTPWGGGLAHPVGVLVHPDLVEADLSPARLRSMFTLRTRSWPDGTPAQIFVLADDDEHHEGFCRDVLGTFPYVLRRAWDRALFAGTGLTPTVVKDLDEMRRRVRSTPGGIGYAPLAAGEAAGALDPEQNL